MLEICFCVPVFIRSKNTTEIFLVQLRGSRIQTIWVPKNSATPHHCILISITSHPSTTTIQLLILLSTTSSVAIILFGQAAEFGLLYSSLKGLHLPSITNGTTNNGSSLSLSDNNYFMIIAAWLKIDR